MSLGSHVCRGWQAEVAYGLTQSERKEAASKGFFIGGFGLALPILYTLPNYLNSKFAWNLAPGFGLGIYSLVLGGVIIFAVGSGFVYLQENTLYQRLPRCFCNGKVKTVRIR